MTGTRQLHDFLAQGLAAFPWPIVIRDPDDHSYQVGGTSEHWCGQLLTIRFKTPQAVDDVLSLNGLGVLERFVRGEVDLTGNLYALPFLKHYLNLKLSYPRLLVALLRNRFAQTVERARINVSSHYDIPQPVLDLYFDRTYTSYSCGMFEHLADLDSTAMRTPGKGEHDTFDSLEKAQWRKFKDAVDLIDPAPGETLLDVGCGYGGQLIAALDVYLFGQVVGCTHSYNQAVQGRQWLRRFDTARWELLEADYRTDQRVFDHVTSTGIISHVWPRGLAPYFGHVRRRIKTGGRYVHHALMTPYRKYSTEMSPGIAFNKKHVWPGFHWFTAGDHVRALERNGFQILRAVNLSVHYAKTAAAWYERLIANESEILKLINTETYRTWKIYLAGCSGAFLYNDSHVYRLYCETI